jgi:hypothetical protein
MSQAPSGTDPSQQAGTQGGPSTQDTGQQQGQDELSQILAQLEQLGVGDMGGGGYGGGPFTPYGGGWGGGFHRGMGWGRGIPGTGGHMGGRGIGGGGGRRFA